MRLVVRTLPVLSLSLLLACSQPRPFEPRVDDAEIGRLDRTEELAGKNAHSTVNNPSEQLGFFQAGKTRPLAAFTPDRLPMFKDIPTFRELGEDYVYFMQRSVVGAQPATSCPGTALPVEAGAGSKADRQLPSTRLQSVCP